MVTPIREQDDQARSQKKQTRSKGKLYQELLDQELVPVPQFLRENTQPALGTENVSKDRYLSREYYDLEMKYVWPKVWQMVCREEELPNVGDHMVYEMGKYSFVVVRSKADEIKAFYNACLHRGRQLKSCSGNDKILKCPYHGFTWNLDGKFRGAPYMWDLPHVKAKEMRLPEAKIDTWGGFVFINWDDNPQPLSDFLGVIPDHFRGWPLENTFKAVHVQKEIRANWKIVWEAFLEVYHVDSTHPQVAPFTWSEESQYDVFGDHVSRTITPQGMRCGLAERQGMSEHDLFTGLIQASGRMSPDEAAKLTLPEGITARDHMAELNRKAYAEASGLDLTNMSKSELMDCVFYSVFPNFSPWGGLGGNIIYRVRPKGDSHESTVMDVMVLVRVKEGDPKPPPTPAHVLGPDEPFGSAPELGALGPLFDQDMGNIPFIHKGLEASKKESVILSDYHESRIRHFHKTLDKYVMKEQN